MAIYWLIKKQKTLDEQYVMTVKAERDFYVVNVVVLSGERLP